MSHYNAIRFVVDTKEIDRSNNIFSNLIHNNLQSVKHKHGKII